MTITIPQAFDAVVERTPDATALVDPAGARRSFGELQRDAKGLARGLLAAGVRPGEVVAVLGDNSGRWVQALLACAYAGCPVAGINTWYTPVEVSKMLSHSGARTVLACVAGENEDRYLGLLTDRQDGAPPGPLRVILDGSHPRPGMTDWTELAAGGMRDGAPLPVPMASDIAAIVYTSGSTGAPKGVRLSHGSLARQGPAIGAAQGVRPGDLVWSHFPLFFSGGLCNFTMGSLLSGAGMVIFPRFEAAEAVDVIQRHRCAVIHAWPNIARRLIDAAGERPERLACLRTGTWPLDLWYPGSALGHVRGINMYGMTETCTVFTTTVIEDADDVRAGTNGRPLAGCEVKVVDERGRRLPAGEEGELRLRGFNLMSGYHGGDPSAGFDEDGFHITSDSGVLQEDGYLRWTGRLDHMIRTSGINVSPIEVEQVLEGLPGVTKAAVAGIPDQRRGEAVAAFVTLSEDAELDEAHMLKWCRTRLAGYKVPISVTIISDSELPLLGSGKLDRAALRATLQLAK